MTLEELVDFMAKICYTTSDKNAYQIHEIYKNRGEIHDKAMKQYIYAKVSICCFQSLLASNSSNVDEAVDVIQTLFDKMGNVFRSMPSYLNYGCNYNEMKHMVGEYQVGDSFDFSHMAQVFVNAIGDVNMFNRSKMAYILEDTERDLRNQILDFYQKKSRNTAAASANGSGCLVSLLGLLAILAIAVII